jgi:hypothetical protein
MIDHRVRAMVFNATFSFIGGLEEVRAPEENKRPVLGH